MLCAKPHLKEDCQVTSSVIRGAQWLVIKNPLTGEHVRLQRRLWNPLLELDGSVTVRQWIERHRPAFGQARLFAVLVHLQRGGIVCDAPSITSKETLTTRVFGRMNPLMVRMALFDPTRFLDALLRLGSGVSVRLCLGLFFTLVALAAVTAVQQFAQIILFWQTFDGVAQLWYAALLYPLSKVVHELAHALVLRRYAGHVPEAGISFLVLFPMPYVEATDAWSLPRQRRIKVTAAGMLADLLMASCGLLLWHHLSSGVVGDMAFMLAMMCLVSIVLFNANPLLKFDGYYLLEDVLDSPGLSRRALAYYRYLYKRYIIRIIDSVPPVLGNRERGWLLLYGALSTAYRLVISLIICVYLITTLHELGFVLSLFCIIPLCLLPVIRFVKFLGYSSELNARRTRAALVTTTLAGTILVAAFTVPLPSSTRTEGVIWVAKQAQVYAAQSGQVSRILVANGDSVAAGQPLIRLESAELTDRLERAAATVRLARLAVERYRLSDPNLRASRAVALEQAVNEQRDLETELDKLVVRSPVAGKLAMRSDQMITGASIQQGELLAYIINEQERIVRAVVDQASLGQVEHGIKDAHVRLAQTMGTPLLASVSRHDPSGSHELPSVALANSGSGGFSAQTDSDSGKLQTREKVFHLELLLLDSESDTERVPLGTRAFVTLNHARETMAQRWSRLSKQLLIKHLSV